ncbi:hypothetical protein [Micromonospora sp. CB01531]|uniref:hypothetical protein n=1 Tax=Micromonospora sp. CB01531 TaxID=1718947 RepID=UPI0009398515|nr:hypothetical protein [Micromonospora sp. CB01531]OKI47225.1 hypothetical protein A6A27_10270 [Micromonospora sp. CB01531]
MQPTIGRIVHYTLTEQDAEQINRRRQDFANRPGGPGHEGFQAHVGNRAEAGQTFPAEVVRTFGGSAVNLQVRLDGTDTYWATSRSEGEPGEQGHWIWPPRV